MDMMCGGFGAVGLALYLLLRDKRWNSALWLCNTCIALAVFTHPNGFVFFLALVAMIAYFDRGRLRWHDLAALTPYVLLASAWGAYILQRPDYFVAQFVANAGAHGGLRWNGLLHPFEAFVNEIVIRYALHYGRHPMWGGPVPHYALVIPFVYLAAFILLWAIRPIRRADGAVALLLLCTLFFSFLTVIGLKLASYLVLILPLYAALLAVLVHRSRQTTIAPIGILLACVLLICQTGVIASKILGNRYASEYQPTIEFLRQHGSGPILADSYFGFDLGFDRVKDDARLGFIGGAKADWVVVDYWYDLWWNELFPQQDPEAVAYTRMLLKNYRLVYNNGSFRVYRRSS
jgi:4-amino-4-deoxy-L-arabinose transferase-like glycosyltransferase